MIFEACERVLEAYAHVGRCADAAWTPKGAEVDAYRLANQELWLREWRLQEQYNGLNTDGCCGQLAPRTVHDTIPRSRFARIYAVGREYDLEREMCYVPSLHLGGNDTDNTPPDDVSYEDIECWQLPEVEACFQALTKDEPQPDFFYSVQNNPSIVGFSNEGNYKIVNVSDKDWISQVPWRAILSERYPAMRELLDKLGSPSKGYNINADSSLGLTPCSISRYTATTLPELALQMKLHSAEIRAIWNENIQCPKRPRRTPRLPMEPSILNSKRFLNADVAEFYPINSENLSSEYNLFQGNNFNIQNHIFLNLRDNIEYENFKINPFCEHDSKKISDFDEVNERNVDNGPNSSKMFDKVYKISHSHSSIKISNYVRNVPSNLKGKYSPSSIQGIEFNSNFTSDNCPNVEEQFSRTPGSSSRQYVRKNRSKKVQSPESADQKTMELLETLSKISTDDDKIRIETTENIDVKVSKTILAMKPINQQQSRPKLLTKSSTFALSEQNNCLIVSEELKEIPSNDTNECESNWTLGDTEGVDKSSQKPNRKVQFLLNNKQITYQIKKKQISNVDVPELIPCFQVKDNVGMSLKISSSLPNISESSDIPEFYPKDYHINIPKKAASVYDKPLRNTNVILPENTSNSINLDARFKSNEHPIPVHQRPREFYSNIPSSHINMSKQRKQHGVDFNNLILLTPNGKEPRKWLHNEYPNRLNEFDKVDNLISQLNNLSGNFIEYNSTIMKEFCDQQNLSELDYGGGHLPSTSLFHGPTYVTVPNVMMQPMHLIPGEMFINTHNPMTPNLMHTQHVYNNQNVVDQNVLTRVPPYHTASQNVSPRTIFFSNRRPVQCQPNVSRFQATTAAAPASGSSANATLITTEMPNLPYSFPHTNNQPPVNLVTKGTTSSTCPSKMNLPTTCKSSLQNTTATTVLNQNQGAKRRLYSAVLSNTNATMDSEYDELERQALEQYRPSEESLKGSSDDSIQAKFQELERLAMEQYSSSSGSSESCALGQATNPEQPSKSGDDITPLSNQNVRGSLIKGSTIRKSSSNLSMSSKKSAVLLPSIGEVSNDEADSPKTTNKSDGIQSTKRKLIILKPSNRPVFSDHSSDGEDNDDCGPQIIATFTDRSQAVFRTPSMMVTINNSSLNEFSPIKSDNCFDNPITQKPMSKDLVAIVSNTEHQSEKSNMAPENYGGKEAKPPSRNRRRQGRNSKKIK